MKRLLKRISGRGYRPRKILTGLFKGIRLLLDPQWDMLNWLGLYERETHAPMWKMMRGCRSFVDLGAGHGELVCLCLKRFPSAPVVAVEPDSVAVATLRSNVALNQAIFPARLTVLCLHIGANAPAPRRTLDEIVAGLPTPIFIKIDIEGPEAEVMRESSRWLARREARLFIETHSLEAEEVIRAQLLSLGYRVRLIHPAWWRCFLPEERPLPHNRWLVSAPA